MRVIWTGRAQRKADEAKQYIAADNTVAAERWIDGLLEATEQLTVFPQSGREAPEPGLQKRAVRELTYGHYRVFYRIEAGVVSILTVRHASRRMDEDDVLGGMS